MSDQGELAVVESDDDLERYLRTAPVEHAFPLLGGGGHQEKKILVLRGGVAVAAKPGFEPQRVLQAHNEVAAWLLAREVGMTDLVPMTVLRQVPGPGGEVEGSAQIMWARFTAAEQNFTHTQIADGPAWRVATFDYLLSNADRNDGNWGVLEGDMSKPALIDHGNSIGFAPQTFSQFAQTRQGQDVPSDLVEAVRGFVDDAANTRLGEVLDAHRVDEIVERGRRLVESGRLILA